MFLNMIETCFKYSDKFQINRKILFINMFETFLAVLNHSKLPRYFKTFRSLVSNNILPKFEFSYD